VGDRRLAEARRFGLDPVLDPERFPTLRAAITAGLGGHGQAARAA
jgi:hypothetical protein